MQVLPILREMLGPSYNIIGFDPRGVGASPPNLDCFHGNLALGTNWVTTSQSLNPTVSAEDFNALFELMGAYGDLCAQELNSSAAYVGTPAVARDMLTFAERQEAKNGGNPEDALLYYYGGSYGSFLGATFATLFPDRVGRLAIDAIGDGEDYYGGKWLTSMHDTDEVEQVFFQSCYQAGPERCVYYADSAEEIETQYRKLLLQFKENPIAVWDKTVAQIPSLATYGQLRAAFLNAAYLAEVQFPVLAQILLDLESRNGSSLLAFAGAPCYDCDKDKLVPQDGLALTGIICADADGRYNLSTREAYREHLDTAMSMSSYAGDLWSGSALACRQWPFHPPPSQKFDGENPSTLAPPYFHRLTLYRQVRRSHQGSAPPTRQRARPGVPNQEVSLVLLCSCLTGRANNSPVLIK